MDPEGRSIVEVGPQVLVDATLAKTNLGTRKADVPLVIGLGPGFEAGRDVHTVVETHRGHNLGRLIFSGSAEPNTGVPGNIGGYTRELFSTGKTVVYPFQLTGKEVARSDMICGGHLEVYLEPVFPENREAVELFETVGARLGAGARGILVTRIADGIDALSHGSRMAVMSDGFFRGGITGLERSQIPWEKRIRPQMAKFPETGPIFMEPIEPDPVLFLFGAGHN